MLFPLRVMPFRSSAHLLPKTSGNSLYGQDTPTGARLGAGVFAWPWEALVSIRATGTHNQDSF